MNERERIIKGCSGDLPICVNKPCVRSCEFLKKYCSYPKELAKNLKGEYLKDNSKIPYACNLCGLCRRVCIHDLDVGQMCFEGRQQLVEEGLGPLAGHQQILENQDWVTSDSFALTLPDPNSTECKRFFFPGCNLSGYSPDLVAKTYEYVRTKLPGTGIMLGCCGGPSHDIGDESRFANIMGQVTSNMQKFGASELIVCCPHCYHIFKDNAQHIKLISIYEIINKHGLPQNIAIGGSKTFAIHDSCQTRYESKLQNTVRELIRKLGYKVEEMEYSKDKTRCCGMGGMAGYIDLPLVSKIINRRAKETPFDIVTYCASCREAFALVKKPSLHILDLIFNPDWEKDRLEPTKKPSTRKENQSLLKAKLEGMYGKKT